MTVSPQLLSSRFVSIAILVIAVLNAPLLLLSSALAESPMPHTSHTTMVIFTDQPMQDDQWSALARELQRSEIRLETAAK